MTTNANEMLADNDFPMTSEQLLERYGDEKLELSNETVREVLERTGSENYEHKEDAEFAIYSGVSEKAIGRKGYSDRDPTPLGSPYGPDQRSF